MAKKLLFPDEVRASVRRSYQLHHRDWLHGGGAFPLLVSLGKPTERDMTADAALLRAWADAWRGFANADWVRWIDREWPRLGRQRMPAQLAIPTASAVAAFVDEGERFERARERYAACATRWPSLAESGVLARAFDVLADYPELDFTRLMRLISWLHEHPRSGFTLRQLPVPGLDTKWIDARRRTLVAEWLHAIRGEAQGVPGEGFYELCGLRAPPVRLRMRVLCPSLRRALGGLCDVEAPLDELRDLPLTPRIVLVVENLDSGLALPDLPGCVAFLGLGNAVTLLRRLPWIMGRPVVYWGDLDTHGFAILDRARSSLGNVSSLLMDEATLLACQSLWGYEPVPCSATELTHLTRAERGVFEGLCSDRWGRQLRLEQERLPWPVVLEALRVLTADAA